MSDMRRRSWVLACLWIGLAAACGGCVEREMLIETEPSDAMVYLDGEKMGPSPVSVNFVHYGTGSASGLGGFVS